ncbi:hypothetical protein [Streptomyces nigra]
MTVQRRFLTSPFGRPGQMCPGAPTRCLECRNAFILPSILPQLLLFVAHLEQLRHRLAPRHFHALWGQSQANLTEVLGLRTNAEISRARQRIPTIPAGASRFPTSPLFTPPWRAGPQWGRS